MSLASGTRIGSYEIQAAIGAGGMGEVYRARDTKLDRHVAIKVLPEAFARDPERLARFEREAKVLASLHHPNIAAIYGLEESADAERHARALVMELVEGQTLGDVIAHGPVPLDEALPIARQIVAALEAAHEQGIVHRDLKPGNIKVEPGGSVKVLDFGLAKMLESGSAIRDSGYDGTMSPTLTTPAGTMAGAILGTAPYMSPEQARGRSVDKRADIWAFGVVLYELLTGERLFKGDDVTETLASIVKEQPDVAKAPRQIRRLLRKCLEKDPAKRLRDIGDAWELLEPDAPRADVTGSRAMRLVPWALAGVLAVTSLVLVLNTGRDAPPPRVTRLELNMPPGVELYTLGGAPVSVSPDGTRVAFIGVLSGLRQIYLRSIDGFDAAPVRGTNNVSLCFFSSDGGSIGFISADRGLKKVSLNDGLVAPVVSNADFDGAAWGADDRIVFIRDRTLWRVPASGGAPEQLLKLDEGNKEVAQGWPAVLPGAGALLFSSRGANGEDRIELLVPATKERRVIVPRGTSPQYVPSGHLIFYRDGELLAAPFDAASLTMTAAPSRVVESVPQSAIGTPLADVSDAGTLVYAPAIATSRLVWVSREGAEQALADTPRAYANPRIAPGGNRLLVQAGDLWIHDLVRSTFTRVTSGEATTGGGFPVWTPDGRLVFRSFAGLRLRPVDTSGPSEPISGTASSDYPGSVSPDGKQLVFVRLSADTSADIYVASLSGDSEVRAVLNTPAYEGSARLSPDGHWIAYSSNESGRMEVFLGAFPGADRGIQVSIDGGTQPVWNPRGRELFYRTGTKMMSVAVETSPKLSLGAPRVLFDLRYAFGSGITIPNYDVSPDGQRFVMVKDESSSGRLNVVLNWTEELRARVPVP